MPPGDRQGEAKRPTTSLILPAYNPGPVVERTWSAVRHFLKNAPGTWEILFVCDGCTDGSADRLRALTRDAGANVRVLDYAPNRGKGYAVRHGLAAARGAWRLFTDIDLAYRFEDVLRLAQTLQAGAPVAIAARQHPESRVVLPFHLQGYFYRRHFQSLVFSQLVRLLLPVRQRDTQAGLKGLSAGAAEVILPHLRCDGFGFDCELLTACARLDIPVTEMPVQVHYNDTRSTTTWRRTTGMVRELWDIRRRWREAPPLIALPVVEPLQRLSA